jgi:putative nucleotidyltransferase with HDIG domain
MDTIYLSSSKVTLREELMMKSDLQKLDEMLSGVGIDTRAVGTRTERSPSMTGSGEFRLLALTHDVEHHQLELSCFRQGHHMKATMSDAYSRVLKALVGRTVQLDFEPSSGKHESAPHVTMLSPVTKAVDPLLTIKPEWLDSNQHSLYREMRRLVSRLDEPYRDLVRAVFRDDKTLQAFLDLPASLDFHHNKRGGLLAHTVDVALDCEQACGRHAGINASLAVAAALLHDVGKCHEYVRYQNGTYGRTPEGELELHKIQGLRILTLAADRCQAPARLVSEICHVLIAQNGAQHMGLPIPKLPEVDIVQSADSRSSTVNLFQTKHQSTFNWDRFGGRYRPSNSAQGAKP